jgi:hypothetical protein
VRQPNGPDRMNAERLPLWRIGVAAIGPLSVDFSIITLHQHLGVVTPHAILIGGLDGGPDSYGL